MCCDAAGRIPAPKRLLKAADKLRAEEALEDTATTLGLLALDDDVATALTAMTSASLGRTCSREGTTWLAMDELSCKPSSLDAASRTLTSAGET